MRQFRIALTGDFLNDQLTPAYGDIGLGLLDSTPLVRYHFLTDQAPRSGDAEYWNRFYSMNVTADHIVGVDGLVVLRPWVTSAVFDRGAGDLAVIGRSGAGYDKIDVAACTANDVAVFNAPLALNHSTASAALLFMLALAKRLMQHERVAREGRWDRQAAVLGGELRGRTLGIVGLGHSGRELVRLVAPFQMRVIAFSPHAEPALASDLGVQLVSLDELLAASDFISLHARLTTQTRLMIGQAQFELMKPTAYLVNVARGELVDQAALVDCLRRRRIAGAALDVFEVEPLPADDPLARLDNVILTPHWAASTSDVWRATGEAMARGMLRAARGEVPENVVNPEVLSSSEFRTKLARFRTNQSSP
jgi:phosphoglycerate dehydrogenase-like enzyme